MDIIKNIKNNYQDTPDLIIHKVYNVYIIYLESICNSNQINKFILENITNKINELSGPNIKEILYKDIDNYLFNSFTIVLIKNKLYAVETKGELNRSISSPQIESDLYGAKDSLNENYQTNIGLIKKRIRSKHLKIKEHFVGRYSNTKTGIMYIDNIADTKYIKETLNTIKKIDIDSIIDAGELKLHLIKNSNIFPAAKLTERPDTIAHALLEGKIAIFVDNSPFAIIIPAVLADFIGQVSDNYVYYKNINFVKVLRMICFFFSIFTPAFYVSVINYNPEAIPPKLLLSIISQRQGVPFPAAIESFFMLFICEILRESDIRFPSSYGSSLSILGALILGEAAVSASIVSPIMIIVISLTYISSMIFSNIELTGAMRTWRFIALLFASFYGLFGLGLSIMLLLIFISSYSSFNIPYTFPVAPFNLPYFKATLLKFSSIKDNFRSKYLTKNIRKKKNK